MAIRDSGPAANALPIGVSIPPGSRLIRITARYDAPNLLKCGMPHCGTPHKKGFIVEFTRSGDGRSRTALIGHVCGRNQFGQDWKAAELVFMAEARRAELQRLAADFLAAAEEAEPALATMLPGLRARREIRRDLQSIAPDLMREAQGACRSGANRLRFRDRRGHEFTFEIQGRLFFLQDMGVGRAEDALLAIKRIRAMATDPRVKPKLLGDAITRAPDLAHAVRLVSSEAEDGVAALDLEFLSRLIELLNRSMPRAVPLRIIRTKLHGLRRGSTAASRAKWVEIGDLASVLVTATALPPSAIAA